MPLARHQLCSSMGEGRIWRALKHQWLFMNSLCDLATLRKLVAFYVEEHNTQLPHSAFRGQTPDEMYLGTGEHVVANLEASKVVARQARFEANCASMRKLRDCGDPKFSNSLRELNSKVRKEVRRAVATADQATSVFRGPRVTRTRAKKRRMS